MKGADGKELKPMLKRYPWRDRAFPLGRWGGQAHTTDRSKRIDLLESPDRRE